MFAWWALHVAGDSRAMAKITAGLASADPIARLRAAYVIRWEQIRDATTLAALARAADTEPRDAIGYAIILSAAFALNANATKDTTWRAALDDVLANGTAGERYQVCLLLIPRFTETDLPRLTTLLDHENGDVRVGAATAVLAVLDRKGK
jgi:hypothetical protein